MTLVEVMASGLAAVSYDCDSGPGDIIRHGENGMLVKAVGDVDMLATQLKSLMLNDAERQRLASRATKVRETLALDMAISLWREAFVSAGVDRARDGLRFKV